MISSLLSRELNRKTNILWIASDNKRFEKMFTKLNVNLFDLDQIYIGSLVPDIIISNDKTKHIEKIITIAKYHQCPIILIDHEEKSDMIDVNKFTEKVKDMPIVVQIALSDQVHKSWDKIHDYVISSDNTEQLENIILKTKKQRYIYNER
jgi:vacuolar-type H+-ATPase subunit F/Vma7